jgi:hypothetical protein
MSSLDTCSQPQQDTVHCSWQFVCQQTVFLLPGNLLFFFGFCMLPWYLGLLLVTWIVRLFFLEFVLGLSIIWIRSRYRTEVVTELVFLVWIAFLIFVSPICRFVTYERLYIIVVDLY